MRSLNNEIVKILKWPKRKKYGFDRKWNRPLLNMVKKGVGQKGKGTVLAEKRLAMRCK